VEWGVVISTFYEILLIILRGGGGVAFRFRAFETEIWKSFLEMKRKCCGTLGFDNFCKDEKECRPSICVT
jgi:hypothetical protein